MRVLHWIAALATAASLAVVVALLVNASPGRPAPLAPVTLACQQPALPVFQRGLAHMASGDFAGAIEPLERATAMDPLFASAWVARGRCELRLGYRGHAADSARRALAVWAAAPWSTGDATAEQMVRDTYTADDAKRLLAQATAAK